MSSLTEPQIKAIAFNAVGRGVETRNYSPFALRWAGTSTSGLSVGYMQWDFGQRLAQSDTANLLKLYNTWAGSNSKTPFLNEASLKAFLGQTGSAANIAQSSSDGQNLSAFFASNAGSTYVGSLEDKSFIGAPGILSMKNFANNVSNTLFVQGLSDAETRIVLAGALDIFNRSPAKASQLLSTLAQAGANMQTFNNTLNGFGADIAGAAKQAIETARLINRLATDTSFI